MKQSIKIILILTLFIGKIYGQTDETRPFLDRGVALYDEGNYEDALKEYKEALKIDKNSALVNYETALTYFALQKYEKAIEHSNVVLSGESNFLLQAYTLKGSALDLLDKSKEAIKLYKQGIEKFPDSHLLYYNLAYTHYKLKEFKEMEDALQKGLILKPSHASSHLLLGVLMKEQGRRVKSLLALYNFLLLEPDGDRAKAAYELLGEQLRKGVKKENEKSTTITLFTNSESDEFSAAELTLSLLEASKSLEINADKTEQELFYDQTRSFFSILSELKKDSKGFWWNYYIDFFAAMKNDNHLPAFCYYISQSKEDETVNAWLNDNQDKIQAMSDWYSNYYADK